MSTIPTHHTVAITATHTPSTVSDRVVISRATALSVALLVTRVALATAFLAAVADRFGLWGPAGSPGVAWGNFDAFTAYTAQLNFFMPPATIPFLAWTATIAEVVLGIALLLGLFTRTSALLSALMLLAFALTMTLANGIKSPLNYSVFSALGAALLVGALGGGRWAIDTLLARSRDPR